MEAPNIIIYNNLIEINNITSLKEFNSSIFTIEINNELYLICGSDLELKNISSDNTSIKISGIINSIEKKNFKKPSNFR